MAASEGLINGFFSTSPEDVVSEVASLLNEGRDDASSSPREALSGERGINNGGGIVKNPVCGLDTKPPPPSGEVVSPCEC